MRRAERCCAPYLKTKDHTPISVEETHMEPMPKHAPESLEGVRFCDAAEERGPFIRPVPLQNRHEQDRQKIVRPGEQQVCVPDSLERHQHSQGQISLSQGRQGPLPACLDQSPGGSGGVRVVLW
ncbi:hypothetical protein C8A03DRAFT_12643 [Achaetomium macrosporum]|uniref:Uncharacterized protein n=1 Tax=Achaetomium macrosporum TaxID=79813 RepID=A0AAN7HHS4_9PEZI|nr:hypothetical protein C8A03DRAFT_12643 [Achaetomium macrosporum]